MPLRLLTVGHSYVLRVNRRLAHAIQAAGGGRWDVTVAAPTHFRGQRDLRPVVLDAAPGEPCPVVPVPAVLTSRVHIFFYGRRLRSVLREGWDVVHAWEEPYIVAGYQAARWTPAGVPYVVTTAQSLNKTYPPPFSWMERWAVGRSAGWVGCGELVRDNLVKRPGYADRPGAVIPHGVDTDAFRPDPAARAATRTKLGWEPDGPPVVGYLGRFVPEKGWGLLTRALDQIRSPWRALFLGGGPDEPAVRAWAAGRPDAVRILTAGHDEVPAYLNAMDVLAVPSQTTPRWKEQFGRALVEGFAAGLAVVGSDSGEIPNVIADAGLVVGEADEPGWVAALAGLIDSPARRTEYRAKGLARAEVFSWPEVGRRHVEFFDRILAGRGRA